MVGAVGSAAPLFLTGWTNDVEVEFMIDTGCQVTILATSVFKRMCEIHPQLGAELVPCTQRLVSADSSPLLVLGRTNLNVVFPGLRCDMCCVVASIGSDGLLGTEALQSCLPHQLDLQTGQLWADGRSTLQLHQQKPTPTVSGSLITAVVLPPDSEVVAAFVTNEGLFQFRVMPFGLCNAPATFERLMDRVLCGMRWSRCLVYLDDVISFGKTISEVLLRLEEVLARLSEFGLQLKAKKCTFMQTEVAFLGHIVGRTRRNCQQFGTGMNLTG